MGGGGHAVDVAGDGGAVAALLVVEGTLLLLRRCLCGGHKDRRPAPMPGRRTVCAAV